MKSATRLMWQIIIICLSLYSVRAQAQEVGVDRPGKDYKVFSMVARIPPEECKRACDADPNCKAYTYVRPGVQGPEARCYLKSEAPAPVKSSCCISGVKDATVETITGAVLNAGRVMAAGGCIDWNQPPPGIVLGLKHSTNQRDKMLVWGGVYDPAYQPKVYDTDPMPTPLPHPQQMTRHNGGDSGGSSGEGFYWYETNGDGFPWPNTTLNTAQERAKWQAFASKLPPGLVIGLRHSVNQRGKSLKWLSEPKDFGPWQFTNLDPANGNLTIPWPFGGQNGGDRGGSSGEGFYWYEVLPNTPGNCDASLPGGLIFGLKHSMNQPNKKFYWHGVAYDAAQRGGPQPPGFVRCHGGDLGAPSDQGYYWFETIGHGATVQNRLGVSCEGNARYPF